MWYVGLTDDPERRRQEHGSPRDWTVRPGQFDGEAEARDWERIQLARPDCKGGPGGSGWRFGYWYTITPHTVQ